MDQWLIRTSDNWIAGPYPEAQIRQMILNGELTYQDEICSANHYWIYLYEREEVMKQLGIEVPIQGAGAKKDDEVTETEFLLDEKTDPNFMPGATTMGTLVSVKGKPSASQSAEGMPGSGEVVSPEAEDSRGSFSWLKKLGMGLLAVLGALVVIALTRWVRF